MLNRRSFAAAIGSGTALATSLPASGVPGFDLQSDPQGPISTDTTPVETSLGRVRGYRRNGIYAFKGVPYAASTAGAARFQPPSAHAGWSGVRSSLAYGPVCPQAPRWRNDQLAFVMDWNEGYPGEDCLFVNIWTPGIGGGRRPVMVWLHGGGFYAGSSYELHSYDGEHLSRRGDVVVVSVNHRIGLLGHLNLGSLNRGRYGQAANAGILDLVAALEWVRTNIDRFGGDPANITLFGQSAGGWKINALTVMPQAQGLFHKAIVQSGSMLRLGEAAQTEALARATVAALGLDEASLDRIHELPAAALVDAGMTARKRIAAEQAVPLARVNWQPTVDGEVVLAHPYDPQKPGWATELPMIIGTTKHERSPSLAEPDLEAMNLQDVTERLRSQLGERTEEVLKAYGEAHPQAKPVELLALISSPRIDAITQAERQAQKAPVHLYWFAWETPVLEGRPRAFHGLDLPFVFDNTDRAAQATGGGERPRILAARMSSAWIAFARTGDPNHPDLPSWPRYEPADGATMIFNDACVVVSDPDRRERQALEAATPDPDR